MAHTLRVIGDVHGAYERLMPLTKSTDYVLQVGDLGLDYRYLRKIKLDAERFKAIGGNHDNYEPDSPEYFRKQSFMLGDYGIHEFPGIPPIFYVRGAWSIDGEKRQREEARKAKKTWWAEEELRVGELEIAIEHYREATPEILVTHEAPIDLVSYVTNPAFARRFGYDGVIKTKTSQAIQVMLDHHKPKWHFFGHYHTTWTGEDLKSGTNYVALNRVNGPPSSFSGAYHDVSF